MWKTVRWRLVVALAVLMVVFSGCALTATNLDASSQIRVEDLYIASTGVYVHGGIAAYVATKCVALGSTYTAINRAVPFSLKRADLVCEFPGKRDIYEIKPKSWVGKAEKATEQITGYVSLYERKQDGMKTVPGRTVEIVPEEEVPPQYVPALTSNGITVLIRTWSNLAPGLITYRYRKQDTRKKLTESTLASILYDIASSDMKWKYDRDRDTRASLVAQEYWFTGTEDIVEPLLAMEEGTLLARGELRAQLMGKLVPDWFMSTPRLPFPIPGAGTNQPGKSWDCDKEKCA